MMIMHITCMPATNKQSGPYTDIHLYIDTITDNLFRSRLNAAKVQYMHACISNEAVITRPQDIISTQLSIRGVGGPRIGCTRASHVPPPVST